MAGLKCKKCGIEFKGGEEKHRAFVSDGDVICEDCLVKGGGDPQQTLTWLAFQELQRKDRPPRY